MTGSARMLAALAAIAAALALAGCGEEDEGKPIRSELAGSLVDNLDRVEKLVDDRRCDDLGPPFAKLDRRLGRARDEGVDPDVVEALADGVGRLLSFAAQECTLPNEDEDEEEDVETVPTETTPPPTETETEREAEPTPPPEEETPPAEIPEVEPEPEVQPELPDEEQDGGIGPPGQRKKDGD